MGSRRWLCAMGSRQWLRGVIFIMSCSAAIALVVGETIAADHRDGPIFGNTFQNGSLDLNDVYVFQSPANPANTVLILTVAPFAAAITPTTFVPGASYELKVDNDGDAKEDLTFRVTFSAPDVIGVQDVTLVGLPRSRFSGMPFLAQGKTKLNLPVQGGGMFRAAMHDDPFFFDAVGFNQLLNLGPFPRPGGIASNFFGPNVNTLALILELPSMLLNDELDTTIGVFGRVAFKSRLIDRTGFPAINTALIPPIPRGSNVPDPGPDLRNAFNKGKPRNDERRFFEPVVEVLSSPTGLYRRNLADSQALADFLLPDILPFDTSNAAGFPNGRRLRDDVIDVELALLTNGMVRTDNVSDDNGTRITDGEMGTTAAFPYIGPPSNPGFGLP